MEDRKPSIAELEAILDGDGGKIRINPDGSIYVPDCPKCAGLKVRLSELQAVVEKVPALIKQLDWSTGIEQATGGGHSVATLEALLELKEDFAVFKEKEEER